MKRRILTISLVVAALVLLVSIGFAAWTIAFEYKGEATGNFQAYGVSDGAGTLTVIHAQSNSNAAAEGFKIVFGKADLQPSITNPWLTLSDANSNAVLETYVYVTFDKNASFTVTHDFLKGGSPDTPDSALIGDVEIELVTGTYTTSGVTLTPAGVLDFPATTGGTALLKVTYQFGDAFDNTNPYIFFNNGHRASDKIGISGTIAAYNNGTANVPTFTYTSGTTTYQALAEAALKALDSAVNNLTFRVTVQKAN